MTRRRRNPISALPAKLEAYVYYVGTVLAPKSKIPAAVYVQKEPERFYVFTPDKEFGIGAGYYGDEHGPGDCIRQHMMPGLLTERDQGTGLGTALYLAGNMVVAASQQDANGEFPWSIRSEECTYSLSGDRSRDADRAWENMQKHGLATEIGGGEGETENVSENYDLDEDSISTDYYQENFREHYENEDDVADVDVGDVDVTGTVTVNGTITRSAEADMMEWSTIKETGLILHLGQFFDDPEDHMFIPPRVFAEVNWNNTPSSWIIDFARQNAEAAKQYSDKGASGADWIREAACHFESEGMTNIAEDLLEMIGEDSQLKLWKRMRNPTMCPTTFAREAASWEKLYGDDFEEGDLEGRSKKKKSKSKAIKQLKNKLLR